MNVNEYYILDENGEPKVITDPMDWGVWMSKANRHVADEMVGGSRVSTVFLGLDHAWGDSSPLVWETLVFDGEHDGEMERCGGSRKNAEEMHARMVNRVKGAYVNSI